jgi:hypothetical protein
MSLTELARTPSMVLVHTGPVLCLIASNQLDENDYDVLEKHEEAFSRRYQQFFFFSVITRVVSSAQATQLAKRRGHPLLRRFAPQLAGSATVIAATGIGASVARSFASAFNLMSGVNVPMRVFNDLHDAFVWSSNLPNRPVLFGDPARMAAEVRSVMEQRPASDQRAL